MSIWQCLICGIPVPGSALGQHFQMSHPELDWHPDHWVDGLPVVYDDLDTHDI